MPTARKAYCFTLNNYTEDEYNTLLGVCEAESRYAVIGREVGESGTPHLQGYICFKRAYRFSTIKDRYLPRCHIEVAAGSPGSNLRYCSKSGNFKVIGRYPDGVASTSGKDEVFSAFRLSMVEGRRGLDQFAASFPGQWGFHGHVLLRNYWTLSAPSPRPDTKVTWVWGSPGIGKSRWAHSTCPDAYIKDPRTKWWNGYLGETTCIIDDFGPGGIDINHLLRWFDVYKCTVENKGGMSPLFVSFFIVTSNFPPSKCFCGLGGEPHPQIEALERRMEIIEM